MIVSRTKAAAAVARRHGITPGQLAVIRASRAAPPTAPATPKALPSPPPVSTTHPARMHWRQASDEAARLSRWLGDARKVMKEGSVSVADQARFGALTARYALLRSHGA